MADEKKYYYLKLKENFFDSDAMIVLESMPDGHLYSNILLKLYLKSIKNDGKLMFNDRIPYNSTILSQVTRHNVGVVEKALKVFMELGLVEILDNGAIYMLDIQNYIGRSSTEADRKREYRIKIEQEKGQMSRQITGQDDGQMSAKSPDKSPPEKEIERETELETETEKKEPAEAEAPLSFESFWNAYPRKVGKKAAETAFKKIKPSQKLITRMIETVEAFKKSKQWLDENGRFIPNPATWLNQGRWDDEIGDRNKPEAHQPQWGDPDYYKCDPGDSL